MPERAVPTRLVVDHLPPGQPSGSARPRGSWWLPAGAETQHAYAAVRITCAGSGETRWESPRRDSDESVLVDLGLPTLTEPDLRWQVKVWTELGESDWSAPSPWRIATLPKVLGTATWIEPHEPAIAPAGQRPAYRLRHEFELAAAVAEATAWATAHGIYELVVNGVRIGDGELTPGFTAYRRRLQVQPYDLTAALRTGTNSVEMVVSDGWFRGRHGFDRAANGFGDRVAALFAAEIRLHDGAVTHVTTGPGWWSCPDQITAVDLMDGQRTDLREPGAGSPHAAGAWHPTQTVHDGLYMDRDRLEIGVAPAVRRVGELPPVPSVISRTAASLSTLDRTSTAGSGCAVWDRPATRSR